MRAEAFHRRKSEELAKEVTLLKKRDRTLSMVRLGLGCGLLALAFISLPEAVPKWPILLVGVALFFYLLRRHFALKSRLQKSERATEIHRDELAYLTADLSPFSLGIEYLDPDHLYATDLDVFGPLSLFRHMDRSVSKGGKDRLAGHLLGQEPMDMLEAQSAVKEISSDAEWRSRWQVEGSLRGDTPQDIRQKIDAWRAREGKYRLLCPPILLYPLGLLCIGLIIWTSLSESSDIAKYAGWAFMANLGLVALAMKTLREEAEALSDIGEYMKVQSGLLQLIEEREFHSPILHTLAERSVTSGTAASERLAQLTDLLDRFEQSNNPVVLIILNGLLHFHLHSYRRLAQWREDHGVILPEWIDLIEAMDMWVSLGNYADNHPDYHYPTVSEEIGLSGRGIGHPLLDPAKRVDNDLQLTDYHYVVLTGSNMSGKSTFLKSIGTNIVLAKCGLPVCAKVMQLYPFELISSMKAFDSLLRQESFFHAEVLRLKRVHEAIMGDRPCFVLLDEILRGTNSEDKRNGTRLFLEKIGRHDSIGIIATHDVDIAELAEEQEETFRALYFESTVENGQLHFDYTLRPGICLTANATDLMKANGII